MMWSPGGKKFIMVEPTVSGEGCEEAGEITKNQRLDLRDSELLIVILQFLALRNWVAGPQRYKSKEEKTIYNPKKVLLDDFYIWLKLHLVKMSAKCRIIDTCIKCQLVLYKSNVSELGESCQSDFHVSARSHGVQADCQI